MNTDHGMFSRLISIYIRQPERPNTLRFVGLAHPELSDERIAQIMRVPDGWEIVKDPL